MGLPKKYDIVAVSASCIDINLQVDDGYIENHGLKKGMGTEIGVEKMAVIIANASEITKTPGSPGANVAMGIALRGGTAGLIGKVANDEHGALFTTRLQSHGIDYMPLLSADDMVVTTCVIVLNTPDQERTFAFVGGAGYQLTSEDIDLAMIGEARITYFDSYLLLGSSAKAAMQHGIEEAHKSGSRVALALNDAGVIGLNRNDLLPLVASHADILLGDQKEFMALFGTKTWDQTVDAIMASGCLAAVTMGAAGAFVIENGKSIHIPAKKVEKIVDTCGAGDQFAAGFLYGLAQGKSIEESGNIGVQWASDIIQHTGAEPKVGKNAPGLPPCGPVL